MNFTLQYLYRDGTCVFDYELAGLQENFRLGLHCNAMTRTTKFHTMLSFPPHLTSQ